MTMLNSVSILLGSMRYPNGSLQIQHESKMTSSSDGGCCGCHQNSCCHDLCAFDPPEVLSDPLEGIPTGDESLSILVGLRWPRRDFSWFMEVYVEFIMPRPRKKRQNYIIPDQNLTSTSESTTTTPTTTTPGTTTQGNTSIPEPTRTVGTVVFSNTLPEVTTTTAPERTFPTLGSTTNGTTPPDNPITGSVNITNITEEDISVAKKFAEEMSLASVAVLVNQDTTTQKEEGLVSGEGKLQNKDAIELEMEAENITFSADDPSLKHQTAFRRTDPISTKMARGGLILIEATSFFQKSFEIPDEAVSGLLVLGPIGNCSDILSDFRRPQFSVCFPNSPYRTLDGSCNNLANILWGAAFRPYRRDLRAEYDDGVSTLRRSVLNIDLPSARLVSTTINRIRSEGSRSLSILHMSFGQFLDHDFVATPLAQVTSIYGGGPVRCCHKFSFMHPDCAPISIPSDDEFYKCFGETCMEFVRSAPIPHFCRFFPREQSSQQSAYLDGSAIYGVQPIQSMELRNLTCGLLKGQVTEDGQTLLPRELNVNDGCNTASMVDEGKYCFKAGDGRVNEQVLLTFFQTLFAREHNRIAKILCKCHADWDDEMIFQEARRIVWALLQQVTYNEFLPTVIGPTLMTSSKLFPLKGDQQTDDYDPYINAAIANNFATAAYRFGHSLIADNLLYVTGHGRTSPKALSTQFFNPFELYRRDAMCDVARGGLNLPEDNMDPYFTLEVAGKLFRGPHPFGLDLLALNIQRGRDHGLPPYNRWRVFCGLPSASSFSDLSKEMAQDRIDALQRVYLSVEDIDLYAGGVSENPIPGGILGHTFTCLIHNQFFRLKYGDRYWFE
ncbi:chorion peroxidase-like [Macrobrachium rosenbergii]|uniref:chorion peroxidase-like n=1 Tax=Macrobrachium rosenbergii TaxID=79674 RepID=UPI0034D67529